MSRDFYFGPAWPTSGAASAGTTGLSVVTSLTHSVTTNRMTGAGSSSVLISSVGGTCGIRVGPISGAGAMFNADPYAVLRCKFRPRVELPGSLPTTDFTVNAAQFCNNATQAITYFTSRYLNGRSGFTMYVQNFAGGGVHYQPNFGFFPFNQWYELTIRMKQATDGVMELFLNRWRISHSRGNYSSFSANTSIVWPAIAGIVWEIEDVEQWQGTDCPMAPLTDLNSSLDDITRIFTPYNDSRNHPDPTLAGSDAITTQVSGSTSAAYAVVSSSGNNAGNTFATLTGSGSVESREYAIGDLPFFDGWAGLYFPMLYYPSGSTGRLDLYRDSALLSSIDLNAVANQASIGGVSYASFSASVRNALCLAISQRGEIDLCTLNQSTTLVDPYIYSANLPDLPGGLTPNRVILRSSIGASGVQLCGLFEGKTLRFIGVDSMTAGPASNIAAPVFQVGTNITSNKYPNEILGVPGINPWSEFGDPAPRAMGITAGRAGQKLSEWVTNQLPALSTMRGGVTIQLLEGGINEVSTVSTLAGAKTVVDATLGHHQTLKAWASAKPGRRLIVSTIIDRSLSTHWSGSPTTTVVGARLSAIRAINANMRALFGSPGPNDRYVLLDVAGAIRPINHAAMIDTTNPPHFVDTGSAAYFGAACALEAAVVRGSAPRSRVFASGAIASGVYG